MYLNDSLIRNAKPGPKPRKLADGDGLFPLVQPNGSRWLRYEVVTRRAVRDPTIDLKGALMPAKRKHYATITYPSEVGALCGRSMDTEGSHRSFIAPCGERRSRCV